MSIERWLANTRARGVKVFWTRHGNVPVCNVTIAYAGSNDPEDESTFYASGEGSSPEAAVLSAISAAEHDPFGKWWI